MPHTVYVQSTAGVSMNETQEDRLRMPAGSQWQRESLKIILSLAAQGTLRRAGHGMQSLLSIPQPYTT